jgi:hypothetical protein
MALQRVLVARLGGGRFFSYNDITGRLMLLDELEFEGDFSHARANSDAQHGHADHKEVLTAKKLAEFVFKDFEKNMNSSYLIFANPHLLGRLKNELSDGKLLEALYIPRDLANMPQQQIASLLRLSQDIAAAS